MMCTTAPQPARQSRSTAARSAWESVSKRSSGSCVGAGGICERKDANRRWKEKVGSVMNMYFETKRHRKADCIATHIKHPDTPRRVGTILFHRECLASSLAPKSPNTHTYKTLKLPLPATTITPARVHTLPYPPPIPLSRLTSSPSAPRNPQQPCNTTTTHPRIPRTHPHTPPFKTNNAPSPA